MTTKIQQFEIQQFEIWIKFLNQSRKFVVLMVLREAQNHKNYKEFFSYIELLIVIRNRYHQVQFKRSHSFLFGFRKNALYREIFYIADINYRIHILPLRNIHDLSGCL